MFKVLVIAYYYPPMGLSGVQRTLKFTKYLRKYNWDPTVLTTGEVGYFAHDLSLLNEVEKNDIRVIRTESSDLNSLLKKFGTIKMPAEWIRRIFSRISKTFLIPDNKKNWSKRAYLKAKEILSQERFDIIYVSAPPFSSFASTAKLREEFDIPLIVDYRDLWLQNQFAFYPTKYHKIKHKKLEYKALRNSDHIIVVNRRIKEELLKVYKFLNFDDISIITHGFDNEDFVNNPEEDREKRDRKIRMLHTGTFYEGITPLYFLKAFKKLTIEKPEIAQNFELHFTGYFRNENHKLARKLNLQDFIFDHGYLDHGDSIRKLKSADILWFMLPDSKNMDTVTVGKLFEYLGARKPILACVPEGISRKIAQEYGASFITSPKDVQGIFNTLVEIYKLFYNNNLPEFNEDFVLKHDRDALTKQLALLFQFHSKIVE